MPGSASGKSAPVVPIPAVESRLQTHGHPGDSPITAAASSSIGPPQGSGEAPAYRNAMAGAPSSPPVTAGTMPAIHSAGDFTTARTGVPAIHPVHMPASDSFDRLDSAAVPHALESTPQRLSVGVRSPELGWVEIRTTRDAGQVSATLATGSVESHSALSTQLPAVRDYLSEHHVHVDTLGSERFAQSSGGREESNGNGDAGHRVPAQENPERTVAAAPLLSDSDPGPLSYISVRV